MLDLTRVLRPKNFDELIGQEHLSSKDSPLRVLSEKGMIGSCFFYGPAGSGKTSISKIIANVMDLPFYELNATSLKIQDLKKIFEQYKNSLQKPLIFIDEIHRLAINQQEVLLPVMEDNSVVIIGASTQNPYFSLSSAIRSRGMLFELKSISYTGLEILLNKALKLENIKIDKDAKKYLLASSGGDARAMLKLLEFAYGADKSLSLKCLKSLRPNAISSGSSEDAVHYNLASALIKSIRGSDMDASVYYLARLIDGGESTDFIARRLVILASEDIGNANPQALTLATSCMLSVAKIGFPEARIILSQTVLYLCSSPKSNASYLAINSALKAVREGILLDIPKNIKPKSAHYLNPHNFNGFVKQKYISKNIKFVELKSVGYEKKMKEWAENIKKL